MRLTACDSWPLGVDEVREAGTIRRPLKCGEVEMRYVEAVSHIFRRRYTGGRSKQRPYGKTATAEAIAYFELDHLINRLDGGSECPQGLKPRIPRR